MRADFLDSHDRHWTDAEHLFQGQRWANADHLYGMAAECGLKRIMLAFGMPFDAGKDRPGNPADAKHADQVAVRYESYRAGHVLGAGYALSLVPDPFADWRVEQRYAHQAHFNQARAKGHRDGAQQIGALVKKARLEGIIS